MLGSCGNQNRCLLWNWRVSVLAPAIDHRGGTKGSVATAIHLAAQFFYDFLVVHTRLAVTDPSRRRNLSSHGVFLSSFRRRLDPPVF